MTAGRAPGSVISEGRQSAVMRPFEESATARRKAFSNSLTLPGKLYADRAAMASCVRWSSNFADSPNLCRKWAVEQLDIAGAGRAAEEVQY